MNTLVSGPSKSLKRALSAFALWGIVALATASGCAKNVDHIEFKKWGNSFVPPRTTDAMDTSVQGGAAQNGVVPKNGVNAMPKAAVGGTYHRTFASSNHYRMVGGFHTPSGQ